MQIRISDVEPEDWEAAVACARLHLDDFPDAVRDREMKAYVENGNKFYVHRTPTGIAVRGSGKVE